MIYNYQIDYGSGYENVYPDNSLHDPACKDSECHGCWDTNDYTIWLSYIDEYDDGRIERARVLFGSQVIEERVFKKDI